MTTGRRPFLREHAFLVAAVALPVLVAGFFILASAIPQWTVPAPAHDLALRVPSPREATPARVTVDFSVRDGRVEATVRPTPPNGYSQRWAIFLFDHETMNVREIPLSLPDSLPEGEASRTVIVDGLAGYRVSAEAKAPDGYELVSRGNRGPGIVGELFGMGRYDQRTGVVNRGRVVRIQLPSEYQYQSPVRSIGWIVEDGRH